MYPRNGYGLATAQAFKRNAISINPNNTMFPRIIFSAIGTKGDIHPMLGLATKLAERGYDVAFLSNDYFKPIIEAAGIAFVSVGTLEQYRSGHSNSGIWKQDAQAIANLAQECWIPSVLPAFSYVSKAYEQDKEIVVVTLFSDNGAAIAAELLGIPIIMLYLSPSAVPSDHLSLPYGVTHGRVKKFIHRALSYARKIFNPIAVLTLRRSNYSRFITNFRQSHGLLPSKERKKNGQNAFLDIAFFPEWFAARASDWPTKLSFLGFPLFDTIETPARSLVDAFIDEKGAPILFFTGTGVDDVEAVFRAGREICEHLSLPGIFIGGSNGARLLVGNENCLHLPYVDFEHTLPKCKAIVHHGGIGTTAQAIRAGLPQIIRPLSFDQPDNASRIYSMGIGYCIPPAIFNAKKVSILLCEMLNNASLKDRISSFAISIAQNDALSRACDLITRQIRFKKLELLSMTQQDRLPVHVPICKDTIKKFDSQFVQSAEVGCDGLACVKMILGFYESPATIEDLQLSNPDSVSAINLSSMVSIFNAYSYKTRALECQVAELSQISLPCILYWDMNRFVVLAALNEEHFVVYDPAAKKQIYQLRDFSSHYCGILLETIPHTTVASS